MRQGNYAQAQKMLEEALALRRELGNLVAIGQTLVALGRVEQLRGDRCHARALYQDALTLHREIGAFPSIVEAIEALAALLAEQDEGPRAARLWGASATIRESIGIPVPASARDEYDQNLERAHAQMTEAAWLATSNEGRAMSLDEAMDCALGESD
ncbi:MAG: hypothetical protein DLM70_08670 [Chloroflexi bacterium]|nr:MAG: hypothetical protein DLM70_08670 [Chloroflexota bacterium]